MQPEVRMRADGAIHVSKGQLLARGLVRNGDHVIVNKFAYHFRKPRRGEVFVFTTKNITGIESESRFDARMGSQHYIKRLVGLPGDHLDVQSPELLINGERAQEPGIRRVIDQAVPEPPGTVENYHGYSDRTYDTRMTYIPATLKTEPRQYFAMGDNSYSSSDSRFWGPVPEQNLVGPGWLCYWPLTKHWGLIK
jgi:signal peptidase I